MLESTSSWMPQSRRLPRLGAEQSLVKEWVNPVARYYAGFAGWSANRPFAAPPPGRDAPLTAFPERQYAGRWSASFTSGINRADSL